MSELRAEWTERMTPLFKEAASAMRYLRTRPLARALAQHAEQLAERNRLAREQSAVSPESLALVRAAGQPQPPAMPATQFDARPWLTDIPDLPARH